MPPGLILARRDRDPRLVPNSWEQVEVVPPSPSPAGGYSLTVAGFAWWRLRYARFQLACSVAVADRRPLVSVTTVLPVGMSALSKYAVTAAVTSLVQAEVGLFDGSSDQTAQFLPLADVWWKADGTISMTAVNIDGADVITMGFAVLDVVRK
jgi:hypothetical protein